MDVYFYEAFEEEEAALRAFLPADIEAGFTSASIQECDEQDPPARFISVRTQSVLPPSWAASLDGILSRSTGYDHLSSYMSEVGKVAPQCGYLPLYCARAVAEQAMLMWTALMRRLKAQTTQFESFNRDGLTGQEIQDKELLVVGLGHIGSEVVRVGEGLGMKVRGVDLVKKYDFVEYTRFEDALPTADVVVAAMNLTPDNPGYFSKQSLARAKRGMIFVNVSRGELSPSTDLLQLLDSGVLGGVGLDVYADESDLAVALRTGAAVQSEEAKAVLQLKDRPNALCLPHNAFNTEESLRRKSEQSVAQVRRFLADGRFVWPAPGVIQ